MKRRVVASLLVGSAVTWGLSLAPLQRPRATLPAPKLGQPSPALFFSPDSRQLVTVHFVNLRRLGEAGNLGSACLWNVATGRQVAALTDVKRLINSVTFSPDGKTFAGRDEGGRIRVWDRITGELRREIDHEHLTKDTHPNAQIVFSPEGRLLYEHGSRWTQMWDVETNQLAFDCAEHTRGFNSTTIRFQNFLLATEADKGVVVRLDTGKIAATMDGTVLDTTGALSADGLSYALMGRLGLHEYPSCHPINVWTAGGRWLLESPLGQWGRTTDLANGGRLLAIHRVQNVRMWIFFGEESRDPRQRIHVIDTVAGREMGVIDGSQAAFAPDGQTLAVGLINGDVQLWDLPLRRRWEWILLGAVGSTGLVYSILRWRASATRSFSPGSQNRGGPNPTGE